MITDFLDEFDNRSKNPKPAGGDSPDEDGSLLEFADKIRATRALPSDAERERVFKRIKMSEHAAARARRNESSPDSSTSTPVTAVLSPGAVAAAVSASLIPQTPVAMRSPRDRFRRFAVTTLAGVAALLVLMFGASALGRFFSKTQTPGVSGLRNPPPTDATPHSSGTTVAQVAAAPGAEAPSREEFGNVQFPEPVLVSSEKNAPVAVEVANGEPPARALRVHGLVVIRAKGETRWHVIQRGHALQIGDTVRASLRLDSGARFLAPDGSAVSIGPGAMLHYVGARQWNLDDGTAQFEVAARNDLPAFTVATPDGTAKTVGTRFLLEVSQRNADEPKKNATLCAVGEGTVEASAKNGKTLAIHAGDAAFLNLDGFASTKDSSGKTWLTALENELNNDRGIGQLIAKTEKANEHLPLEIASHSVSVTCVDQVARTFVDEIFVNNTDRQLEGTFYYPLPADAAIGEFAMYVNGKRIVGEVLEQNKARQVYEYIVRQQKDPALLEWAGGNIFKMRVFPIEAHSQKHIQLGYTQILARRNGTVTCTYPLYSEMLIKNPLQKLSIEFRVLSDAGLIDLASPSHVVGVALDKDGKRGTLAFRAQNYSPTRDFAVTYKVPDGAECIATANAHPDDADPYFMLQLSPKAALPARKPPERLLVIVDGAAASNAQDYAVATEFAASCADVSSNWEFRLMRGGPSAEFCALPDAETRLMDDNPAEVSMKIPLKIVAADPDEGILSFVWKQLEGPKISIADPKAAVFDPKVGKWISLTYFVPTEPGNYVFEVTVKNEAGLEVKRKITQAVLAAKQPNFGFTVATSSAVAREFLAAKPPLGASDLLATFQKAAESANDGKPLHIVYVGGGIDALSELGSAALVERIGALFVNKNVRVSTVAIGSSYERAVLQGIASTLGGSFTRVEGAADVHAAVEQVFDSFYRPQFWNAHIKIAGLETRDVHPELIGTLAAGDTAIVLGRFKGASPKINAPVGYKASVTFAAENDAGLFQRAYPVDLVVEEGRNNFLPRLWARAHNDALLANMGAGTPAEDANAKRDVIANSIAYQIMSPYTSFLVLDSEEAYARYGIQRSAKRVDWMGGMVASETEGKTIRHSGASKRLSELSDPYLEGFKDNLESESVGITRTWAGTRNAYFFGGGQNASMPVGGYLGWDVNGLVDGIEMDGEPALARSAGEFNGRLDLASDLGGPALGNFEQTGLGMEYDSVQEIGGRFVTGGDLDFKALGDLSAGSLTLGENQLGRRMYRSRPHSFARRAAASFASSIFPYGKSVDLGGAPAAKFEFTPDRPLKASALYERTVARRQSDYAARMNWVLALEAEEHYTRALKELALLLEIFPASVELKLEQGLLMALGGDAARSVGVLDDALKLSDAKSKPAIAERIAATLSTAAQYGPAALRYADLARTAVNGDEAARLAGLAATNWQYAKDNEKCTPLWQEIWTRWPENAAVNSGAGNWFAQHLPGDPRGLTLLRKAAGTDVKFAPGLISTLIRQEHQDEAAAEARRFLDAATEQQNVYEILINLAQSRGHTAIDEAKRLLNGPCNAGQFTGAVQYWSSYSIRADKEFTQLIAAGIARAFLSEYARAYAAFNLTNAGAAGMTPEKMVDVFKPLLPMFKSDEELRLAANAALNLWQRGKNELCVTMVETLLKNPAVKDDLRAEVATLEFNALAAQNRRNEFFERHNAEFFTANPTASEKQIVSVLQAVLWNYSTTGDLDAAAERVTTFAKRFPDSDALPSLYAQVLRIAGAITTTDERAAAIERLWKKYPGDVRFLELRARSLAQRGKIRDAAALIRTALNEMPPAPATSREAAQKSALLNLLALLSAQDAGLREAFLKEADENAKTQDPVQREWTEAALACLHAAGEEDRYISTLVLYAALDANDPEWPPRVGAALLEAKKYKEARVVFEALSNAAPDDIDLAFACRDICVQLKDEKAAAAFFDRAFEAIAANPNRLARFASDNQSSNPEWALKAYARMAQDPDRHPVSSFALYAADAAHNLGRKAETIDWYFKTLFDPDGCYFAAAVSELAALAQNESEFKIIEPRARAALGENPGAVKAIGAHLLLFNLKKMKNDDAGARAELDAAMKIDLPRNNGSYLAGALFVALATEKRDEQIETYALNGGGALSADARRQMIREAIGQLTPARNYARAIALLRVLLKEKDYNSDEDRRQVVDQLVSANQLDEAVAEARKFESGTNASSVSNAWERIVEAYRSKGDAAAAVSAALEMWNLEKDDPDYASTALYRVGSAAHSAKAEKKLDDALMTRAREAFLYYSASYFDGTPERWNVYVNVWPEIATLGLRSKFDALARQAADSGDTRRVLAAARYYDRMENFSDARGAYERMLLMDAKDTDALTGLYGVCADHAHDWETANKMLDRLQGLKVQDEVWLKTERVRCLHGLKKTEEARTVGRELMKLPNFIRNGYWNIQNVARECESAKDFALAAEFWELSLRVLRTQQRGRVDASTLAQFYRSCGNAYAQNGESAKALDCFLRGMSAIPRTDSNYQTVLNAALDISLKGKTLAQAVAAHENNVATDGNDKPHLRIAFAEAYKRENKTREMLGQLRIAADLLPKDTKLRQEVIDGYKKLNDTDAALDEYRRWAALDPQNIEIYRGWGDLYESLGRRGDAILAWATMAEVRPREAEGFRAYGEKLSAIGEHEKAAAAFRHALKYRPTEYDIAKELAAEYAKLDATAAGQKRIAALWTDGESACRKAIDDVPDDPAAWLNLGRFLEAQKRTKDARELYEKIAVRAWPRFRSETTREATKRLGELK